MPFSSSHSTGDVGLRETNDMAVTKPRTARTLRALLVTCCLCTLIGSYLVAGLVQSAATTIRSQQLAHRTEVTATLLASSDNRGIPDSSQPIHATVQVPARWTVPNGQTHTGLIAVGSDVSAGDRQTIWVDRSGEVAAPPLGHWQIAVVAITAGMGVNAAGAALVLVGYRIHQHRELQRRLRAWEAEWAEIAPQWMSR